VLPKRLIRHIWSLTTGNLLASKQSLWKSRCGIFRNVSHVRIRSQVCRFPLKVGLNKVKLTSDHWKVSGVVFAYFENGTWIFGEEAEFLPRTELLRSQNVGSVSYYLRALAISQSNQLLECCYSVNHFTDAVIFCL
jgi:hypothetical protein